MFERVITAIIMVVAVAIVALAPALFDIRRGLRGIGLL
jgi:hypothetical protein